MRGDRFDSGWRGCAGSATPISGSLLVGGGPATVWHSQLEGTLSAWSGTRRWTLIGVHSTKQIAFKLTVCFIAIWKLWLPSAIDAGSPKFPFISSLALTWNVWNAVAFQWAWFWWQWHEQESKANSRPFGLLLKPELSEERLYRLLNLRWAVVAKGQPVRGSLFPRHLRSCASVVQIWVASSRFAASSAEERIFVLYSIEVCLITELVVFFKFSRARPRQCFTAWLCFTAESVSQLFFHCESLYSNLIICVWIFCLSLSGGISAAVRSIWNLFVYPWDLLLKCQVQILCQVSILDQNQ